MYNRMSTPGPYLGGGSGNIAAVVTPSQFNGFSADISPSAQGFANDLWSGNAPQGGSTGNATFFAAPVQGNAAWAAPGSPLYQSGTNIGGNFYSDQLGAPSGNFIAPAYGSAVGADAGSAIAADPYDFSSLSSAGPSTYGDISGFQVAGVTADDSSGIASQNDALSHSTLGTSQGSAAVAAPQGLGPTDYPALNSQTSVTSNDQQFNQPDPNKVQVTDIASSGLVGQEKVATATTGAGSAVQSGLNTAGQDVLTSEQQAVSGLGDLFARGSLVGIGLLLLAGAFVFYYMQQKDFVFHRESPAT